MTPIEKLERYIRKRYETNESFENLVASLKEEQKKQMIDFYTWMRRNDSAEEYFHYTDVDMLEQYLKEGSPQDPAICNYSGLRPVEGYKEVEDTIKNIDKKIKELEDRRSNTIIEGLK